MKYNKKLVAGALASLMMVSSLATAAPDKKNLVANYGVVLRVNGSNFAVTDSSMRPFITQDGRTYVSIAALNQMGIATAAYDKASKTVSVNSNANNNASMGGNVAQLQQQVQAQTAEISRLQYENNQLKAEIDKLKNSSSTTDNKKKDNGSKDLADLSRSEKRDLEKDIKTELKYLRADSRFDRSQRFDGEVSIDSKSITLSLVPYEGNFTENYKTSWNNLYTEKRDRERLEEDFASFVESDVRDMLKGVLKDYKPYNITVTIYSDTAMKSKIVEADYNANRARSSASVYKIS